VHCPLTAWHTVHCALQVLHASSTDARVRAYAFRGSPPSTFSATACGADGALQLLLLNLHEDESVTASLTLPVAAATPSAASAAPASFAASASFVSFAAWSLTPPADGPFSVHAQGSHSAALSTACIHARSSKWRVHCVWYTACGPSSHSACVMCVLQVHALLNGRALPDRVDGTANATAFLEHISVAATRGKVADGVQLPKLSVTFVCLGV
jgi:hypothetical protein